jgi:hypothetical protein
MEMHRKTQRVLQADLMGKSYKWERRPQDERSALTMFSRAARTDGKNPPMRPISKANKREDRMIEGESANENASSANQPKTSVKMVKN